MSRNSYTNELSFNDAEESVKMTIDSKCPDKWLFADRETGDIWEFCPNTGYKFWGAPKEKLKELHKILETKKLKEILKG